MVQPAFEIGSSTLADLPADGRLLIEMSGRSLNYIIYTKEPNRLLLLRQYRVYATDDRSARDQFEEIISGDAVLEKYAQQAMVVYNFPNADLVPAAFYSSAIKNDIATMLTGGTESDFIFDEQVRDWDMQNIYRVSKEIHSLCREKFKSSQYWHLYTLILRSIHEVRSEGSTMTVIFYNDKFVAACFKDGRLQLLQSYIYQTPEDVAFYLLSICGQLNISQHEMVLNISGLIDSESALYTELLKYFPEVNYEGLPLSYDTSGLLEEFPGHYFSPILKMSLCV